MARLNQAEAGFVPPAIKVVKPKKRKATNTHATCVACGFHGKKQRNYRESFGGKLKELCELDSMYEEEDGWICGGCASFFGVITPWWENLRFLDWNAATERMGKLRECKWGVIMQTQTFSSTNTGADLTLEFGDIFPVVRFGVNADELDGTTKKSKKAFTCDVQMANEPVTLYMHEISPIAWLDIMRMRADKEYEEAFVSPDDTTGFFQPVKELRGIIRSMFGER